MQFNTVGDIHKYIESFPPAGKKTTLERTETLCDALGDPQNSYKIIHVAGSKGKGSVCAFIASALRELGHKTGLYMSPHVVDFRERFTLSGEFFNDTEMIETARELYSELCKIDLETLRPSIYDIYTAYAFMLFKKTNCEYVVLETGLGGRLDATNISRPICSVITPIELEHTEILGNTISEIALEKAKIIKKNTPVFVSYQTKEATEVFLKEAKDKHSPIFLLGKEIFNFETHLDNRLQKVCFSFKDDIRNKNNEADCAYRMSLSMLGRVQAENAALGTLVLKKMGFITESTKKSAIRGMEKVSLPARMQEITCFHTYYVDGAHTENSIRNAVETMKTLYPDSSEYCIFGCISNKNYKAMCDILIENFSTVIVSKPNNYKKSNTEEIFEYLKNAAQKKNIKPACKPCKAITKIRQIFRDRIIVQTKVQTTKLPLPTEKPNQKSKKIYLIEKATEAIDFLNKSVSEPSPILVCGSFYLADEYINALNYYNT